MKLVYLIFICQQPRKLDPELPLINMLLIPD
jgi:hypothetical protein